MQTGKEVIKLPLLADDMITVCTQRTPKIPPRNTRTDKFSKVAGYKINIQKSVAFLYANNKLTEREIKKTIPLIFASKITKYLGINLTKDAKDLQSEIYKTLKK